MAHISLIIEWAKQELQTLRAGHHDFKCPRCKGRGFRVVIWLPCTLCGGYGKPIARPTETADRLERYIDQMAERIHSQAELLGIEIPPESVEERARRHEGKN